MSKEKPVVVYLHRYPPETEALQWPGLRALIEELAPTYDLVYLCMGPGDGQRDAKLRERIRVMELPFGVDQGSGRDKWWKTLRWYGSLGWLMDRIRELRPAAILCKEALPFIPARVASAGFPTFVAAGDWWWSILLGQSKWGRRFADWMETREIRSWNRPNVRIVICTKTSGRMLEARGAEAGRIAVINEPQNRSAFGPLDSETVRRELQLDAALKYFAIFGIIRGGKGYDQLLDWWKTAVRTHADWRLVIIGGAGGEAWCRREIARRGLGDVVRMTGWLPTKQDVNRWLNAMDAVVVQRRNSPDNEGIIPSALYNGLSTGRPVVATGLPGIAEVVRDGVDGFLFAPDDGASFLAALERVVADPAAAAQVGRAGMARAAECFDPRQAARTYRELIESMAGRPA